MEKGLIGIFDSGVGGMTVADKVLQCLPSASFIYFGDTKYVPYGNRPAHEVVTLISAICRHLVDNGCKVLVMACNTSSALALEPVRQWCPVPVIAIIESAAQAAVQSTKNGNIGVIANKLTASSGAYEKASAAAFAKLKPENLSQVNVYPMGCPKLVPLIEAGTVEGPEVEAALNQYLLPLKEKDIDTLVLGCTHYPFLRAPIEKILGDKVTIIDPATYVANELKSMGYGCDNQKASVRYQVSGDSEHFAKVTYDLLKRKIDNVEHVELF